MAKILYVGEDEGFAVTQREYPNEKIKHVRTLEEVEKALKTEEDISLIGLGIGSIVSFIPAAGTASIPPVQRWLEAVPRLLARARARAEVRQWGPSLG